MSVIRLVAILSLLTVAGCQRYEISLDPTPVAVEQIDEETLPTAPENTHADPQNMSVPEQGGADPSWLPSLRRLCKAVDSPEKKEKRHTEGSDKWKSLLEVNVKDFRIYSPMFKKWTLQKVDNPNKQGKIRHRGPWYGYGLMVEVTNKSDQVLAGDSVYVWATFKSKTGERVCFADASASRSWNSFAKKGTGAWVKEREISEWPLRPQEKKRYIASRTSCFSALFTETEPTSVTIDLYMRFRPLGGEAVVVGPVKTIERNGGLLRGMPIATDSRSQQLKKKKAAQPVQALFMAGDHVMIQQGKKTSWVPMGNLVGVGPESLPKLGSMPAEPAVFSKAYGATTITVDKWNVMGWRQVKGLVKQGHKMLSAKVSISIDASAVRSQLESAVAAATGALGVAQGDVATKQATMAVAQTTLIGVKGTEAEPGAKGAVKVAKGELKVAKGSLKVANKAVKAANKALANGEKSFLKTEAKNVNCGSFRLEVGRKSLKPYKGSLNAKACKTLVAGLPVTGTLWFDLERWDMPFAISWKGPGGVLQTHSIQSQRLATILRD